MKIGQKKLHSFSEACVNTFVGFGISLVAQLFVFPLLGIYITYTQNLQIALIFTALSILRNYILRRIFNYIHCR